MDIIISLLISLLIFGILVMVHEWGHFYFARKNGIFVEEFALGMGPLLLSKKDKTGTLYSIRLLPIGGYCKMLGEDTENSEEGSYQSKSVFARMSVIVAGSFMNFVLSFVFALILVSVNGFASLNVSSVIENTPAYEAGLLPGDRITHINNRRIFVFADISFFLSNNGSQPMDISINRNGQSMTLYNVSPARTPAGAYLIGFVSTPRAGLGGHEFIESASIGQILMQSINLTLHYTRIIGQGLIQLITFNLPMDDIGGPVRIVGLIGEVYQESAQAAAETGSWVVISNMMSIAALLSANLGLFNLLPFPALDGGRLVFLTIEAIRGKQINQEKEGLVHLVGFVLLLGLIAVVFFNDIASLFR